MRNSIKLRLIVCSMVLFTCAVGINVFLNSSSVDRLYQDSTISQYGAIGEHLKAKLTRLLEAGQKIEEIRNIQQILAKTEESLKQVPDEDIKLILSHKFCTILLYNCARTVSALVENGLLKETEAGKILEEIQALVREVNSEKEYPGELKRSA